MKVSIILLVSIAEQSRLSLTWSKIPETGFPYPELLNANDRLTVTFFFRIPKNWVIQ